MTSFKLERLVITHQGGPIYAPTSLQSELQQLHSGLKVLRLYFPGALEALLPQPQVQVLAGISESESEADIPSPWDEALFGNEIRDNGDKNEGGDEEATILLNIDKSKVSDDAPPSYCSQGIDEAPSWNLGLAWPSLERLELGICAERDVYDLRPFSKCDARAISLLPHSLTHLTLANGIDHPLIHAMPPNLKTRSSSALVSLCRGSPSSSSIPHGSPS